MARLAVFGFLATVEGATDPVPVVEAPATCGDMKQLYRQHECCGEPSKAVGVCPVCKACPYNFDKPTCADAEVQAPRDLSDGATGTRTPKAIVLTSTQGERLPQVNVHYHLGAEHKSENYKDSTFTDTYDTNAAHDRRLAGGAAVRPGFMCGPSPLYGLTGEEGAPYVFTHCTGDVAVGKSYEVHYVHSSAGLDPEYLKTASLEDKDKMADGLGGAANGRGQLNPMVVVQAQVFQIVNGADADGAAAPENDDLVHGWTTVDHKDSVMYAGSTTGQSHDNEICSPYAITWHVDKACHKISAASFDNMCKQMKDLYHLEGDLTPHGSRKLVSSEWVVPAGNIYPYGDVLEAAAAPAPEEAAAGPA